MLKHLPVTETKDIQRSVSKGGTFTRLVLWLETDKPDALGGQTWASARLCAANKASLALTSTALAIKCPIIATIVILTIV